MVEKIHNSYHFIQIIGHRSIMYCLLCAEEEKLAKQPDDPGAVVDGFAFWRGSADDFLNPSIARKFIKKTHLCSVASSWYKDLFTWCTHTCMLMLNVQYSIPAIVPNWNNSCHCTVVVNHTLWYMVSIPGHYVKERIPRNRSAKTPCGSINL